MAKVLVSDDLLWSKDGFEFRAMRRGNGSLPAREWFDGLDQTGKARFFAAAQNVVNNFRSGRPGGRAEKVKFSDRGLWEFKVTAPGADPPHLRALFVRERNVLWLTHGFTKTTNRLGSSDVRTGERIADEWRERRSAR